MSCWRAFLHEVFLELRDIPVFAKLGILHLQTFLNFFSHSSCLCRSCLEVGSQIETFQREKMTLTHWNWDVDRGCAMRVIVPWFLQPMWLIFSAKNLWCCPFAPLMPLTLHLGLGRGQRRHVTGTQWTEFLLDASEEPWFSPWESTSGQSWSFVDKFDFCQQLHQCYFLTTIASTLAYFPLMTHWADTMTFWSVDYWGSILEYLLSSFA